MSALVLRNRPRRRLAAAGALLVAALASPVLAQTGGGGTGGGGTGGGGTGGTGTDTPNTIGNNAFSGVAVDAQGVVRNLELSDPSGQLLQTRLQQAAVRLDAEVARPSKLRKVSLTRLIAQLQRDDAQGLAPDDAMERLAGLTRISYVFYYPETKDVVLAGPAEGWVEAPNGRFLGLHSGRPVMELRDLAAALRAFAPGRQDNTLVYCSIDPTQEGLARMQQFLSQVGRYIQPNDEQFIVEGLQESLGPQLISVGGVSPKTHFAQVMVEADYRMKLIGVGLEEPPVRIPSWASLASGASISRNAMQRWYFVPDYQRIMVSEDGLAAQFTGRGVKLVGDDEVVDASGGRSSSRGGQSSASRRFTRIFTDKFGQLAEASPVYAQLRNGIDMLIAAAFIQRHDLFGQAGLTLGVLGDEQRYPIETLDAPKQVASAVNSMWDGRTLKTPIGGGVEIRAALAVEGENVLADKRGEVAKARSEIDLKNLPADQWWWD